MKIQGLIACLLPMALLVSACSRDADMPAVSQLPAKAATPANNKAWLQAALHCGDAEFLRLSHEEQKARMQQDNRWQCNTLESEQGPILRCSPTEPQQAFASRIFAVNFNHPLGAHHMALEVQNDVETLKQIAASIWQRALSKDGNELRLSDDGDVALHFDADNGGDNQSSITCAIAPGSSANPILPANWQNPEPVLPVSEVFPIDTESSEGYSVLEGDNLLKAVMVCNAEHWLSLAFKQRVDALQSAGANCKSVTGYSSEGSLIHQSTCTLPYSLKSFDGSALAMLVINDDGERHETRITVDRTPKQLAAAMQKATMTDLSAYPGSAGMYQNLLDDRFQHIVFPHKESGASELVCRLSKEADQVAGPESTGMSDSNKQYETNHNLPSGSISGTIQYPSEKINIPAMQVCAIHGDGSIYRCTYTEAGQDTYRIDNLDAADYVVVAELSSGDIRVGGHANAIRCIRAPCPQSTLIPVMLHQGENKHGISINEFLSDRGEWPKSPMADRE